MQVSRKAIGVVALLAVVVVGCGDDDDDAGSTTTTSREAATSTTVAPAGADLESFLLAAGDAAGFSPSSDVLLFESLDDYALEYGIPEDEKARLLEHGFEAGATYLLDAPSEGAGISVVDVFATEDGAARELEHVVANKEADAPSGIENFERFDIPGVPGAVGWTFDKPGGSQAADIHWVQGRCLMSLGSEPPPVDELQAAVKALYERTGGTCP